MTILRAFAAAALALVAAPAPAQQGKDQQQTQDQHQARDQQQAQNQQGQTPVAPNQPDHPPQYPIVVVDFTATDLAGADMFPNVVELARKPYVARLSLTPVVALPLAKPPVSGMLVFEGIDAYEDWRSDGMHDFFDVLGESATVASTLRITRSDLLRASEPLAGGELGNVTVNYVNEGNTSEKDADLDAVTVICTEDANCSPTN